MAARFSYGKLPESPGQFSAEPFVSDGTSRKHDRSAWRDNCHRGRISPRPGRSKEGKKEELNHMGTYTYEGTLATAQRVNWKIEDIIGGDSGWTSRSRSCRSPWLGCES